MDEPEFDTFELPENDYIKIVRSKTCISKSIFVYNIPLKINSSFIQTFSNQSQLTYPLGEKYPYFNINYPSKYLISGIIGENELKLIPRILAKGSIRKEFEDQLISWVKKEM